MNDGMKNTLYRRHDVSRRPAQFRPLCDGRAPYVVMSNRNNVQVGDVVDVCEIEPVSDEYTGDQWCGYVTHVERISGLFSIVSLRFVSAVVCPSSPDVPFFSMYTTKT